MLPLLFVSYVFAYLDRVNIGFAVLEMREDLGFSAAVYGLGAGIFFAGYVLFEVPSNLLLTKIGARLTIMRIMIGWGLMASAMIFVQQPWHLYAIRFLLGVFEAGFFPCVVFYITFWFPARIRGSIIALFMSATAVVGVIGGPLSGLMMVSMDNVAGLRGWQWMFVLQGLPAVFLGVAAGFILHDGPSKAAWLSDVEKKRIAGDVSSVGHGGHSMGEAIRNLRVYALGIVYFSLICGLYILGFWLPSIIKVYGVDSPMHIGMLTSIHYLASIVGMIVIGRYSDRTDERRWLLAICMTIGATGLVVSTFFANSLVLALACLTVASVGMFASMPVFWTIPTRFLSGTAAAGGIALINSIALFGGFLSPTVMGFIVDATGSTDIALYIFSAVLVGGSGLLLAALLLAAFPERLLK